MPCRQRYTLTSTPTKIRRPPLSRRRARPCGCGCARATTGCARSERCSRFFEWATRHAATRRRCPTSSRRVTHNGILGRHAAGSKMPRGHSFGFARTLSQKTPKDPRTDSRLASGRWHLVPPYACEPSRPIRVWDAMRAVGVVGLPRVDRGGREVGGYSGLSSSAVSRLGVWRCVRMCVRRCT